MTHYENCSEIISIKNSEEKAIIKDNSKDEYSTQLNECLSKKSNNIDNNNLDKISENTALVKETKQNSSNKKTQRMNDNENDSFWELNSSNNIINKYEQIITDFDTIKNNNNNIIKVFNIKKEMIIETQNDFNNTNKINDNCIGAKKKLFKVIYPKNFIIFNRGNYLEKFINQILIQNSQKLFISKSTIFYERKKRIARKNNADNIRKKIKSRFLKILKNTINEKLKLAGSKHFFNFLPQKFISNITKEKNRILLDLTFKELFSKNFCEEKKADKASYKKYEDNQLVLNYLENNKEISEKSKYNLFKNMKYYEIFDEYLNSKEFEMEIERLKRKNENYKYIRQYIKLARYFIDFFYQ